MPDVIGSGISGVVAIVIVLGLCLVFHETGHFVVAKLWGMRVHDFALGFGPALISWVRGETKYAIRIIPFGAFVRIAGMEPGEADVVDGFHSRPRWQGALVIFAGPFMNVVLAVLLLTIVIYTTGIAKAGDSGTLVLGFVPGGVAKDAGLLVGDRIVAVDGNRFSLGVADVKAGSPAALVGLEAHTRVLQVDEDSVSVPPDLASHIKVATGEVTLYCINGEEEDIAKQAQIIRLPLATLTRPTDAGLGSSVAWCRDILGLTFEPLDNWTVISYVSYHPDMPIELTVQRQGRETTLSVMPARTWAQMPVIRPNRQLDTPWQKVGRIGILLGAAREPVTLGSAVRMGFSDTGHTLKGAVQAFRALIRRQVSMESASGPIGIMAVSYETAKKGWMEVLGLCGLVSVSLAVVNLLPIPPFDGFHIVLLGYEGVIRRRIDAGKQVVIMVAGFILVISLILVLSYKDIWDIAVHR